jgi:hypothetical protein
MAMVARRGAVNARGGGQIPLSKRFMYHSPLPFFRVGSEKPVFVAEPVVIYGLLVGLVGLARGPGSGHSAKGMLRTSWSFSARLVAK